MDATQIYNSVSKHYSSASQGNDAAYGQAVAKEFGYSVEELTNIPEGANLGLSCGNPTAIAKLKDGETVVDLGSGAGFDVFLAAKQVGSNGEAIGIDMNKEMLQKANQIKSKSPNANNISFVESPITKIALNDATADCMISNCVINLVPEEEKQLVFNEMFRVLKPGGRVAVSDILAKRELPAEIKSNMELYVGCIAGASQVEEYETYLRKAGFNDVLIVDAKSDLNIYITAGQNGESNGCCGPARPSTTSCCSGPPQTAKNLKDSPSKVRDLDFNEFAGSFKIYALKP